MTTITSLAPPTASTDLWGIVLTSAGDGRGSPWRAGAGVGRTIGRACEVIPARQLVAVSAPGAPATAVDGVGVRRLAQPAYRGSAAAVFLPLLMIARREPEAIVAVFPGTGAGHHGAGFMTSVGRASTAVAHRPELLLVMGAAAPFPPHRGWIEPGEPIAGLESLDVRAVRRFVRRSRHFPMLRRPGPDGIVNTGVVVAAARTLLELGRRRLPDVLERLERLDPVMGGVEDAGLPESVYASMPYADLSQALGAADEAVGVLPVRRERARLTRAASA